MCGLVSLVNVFFSRKNQFFSILGWKTQKMSFSCIFFRTKHSVLHDECINDLNMWVSFNLWLNLIPLWNNHISRYLVKKTLKMALFGQIYFVYTISTNWVSLNISHYMISHHQNGKIIHLVTFLLVCCILVQKY